jgi:hypothetical protein
MLVILLALLVLDAGVARGGLKPPAFRVGRGG